MFDTSSPMPENAAVHLRRLATPLHPDLDKLKAQWQDIFPRARSQVQSGASNREAWRDVLKRLASCKALLGARPTDVLRRALIAYTCLRRLCLRG